MLSRRSAFPRRGPVSERVFGRAYADAEHGGSWLAAGLFAIAFFLLIVSMSLYEITRPERAQTLLAAGIAALTDIDQAIEENLPALREEARDSSEPFVEIPGYPLPIALSRVEALTADVPTLRALILERSARLVYALGLDAFDETGEQSLDLLSVSTLIRELVGFLTGDVHGYSRWVAVASLIVATLLGAATLAVNRGFARFTSFGLAVLLASAPGYLAARGGAWLLDRFGSGDAFVADLQAIVLAMLAAPERNFLITGLIGLAIAVAGWLLGLLARSLVPEEARDPIGYDAGPALPFTAVPGPAHEFARRGGVRLPDWSSLRQRFQPAPAPRREPPAADR